MLPKNDPIQLTPEDVQWCFDFAQTAANLRSQSDKQFGSAGLRTRNDFVADQVEGKLTEIALKKFLSGFGLEIMLDFEHYPDRLQLDRGDIAAIYANDEWLEVGVRVDAKGSTGHARWLLVEEHKYNSDFYIFLRFIDLPSKAIARRDPVALLNHGYTAEAVGWAAALDFVCPETGYFWFRYEQGSSPLHPRCLPPQRPESYRQLQEWLDRHVHQYMAVKLDAPLNYGLPAGWLRTDWNALIHAIRASAGRR